MKDFFLYFIPNEKEGILIVFTVKPIKLNQLNEKKQKKSKLLTTELSNPFKEKSNLHMMDDLESATILNHE